MWWSGIGWMLSREVVWMLSVEVAWILSEDGVRKEMWWIGIKWMLSGKRCGAGCCQGRRGGTRWTSPRWMLLGVEQARKGVVRDVGEY